MSESREKIEDNLPGIKVHATSDKRNSFRDCDDVSSAVSVRLRSRRVVRRTFSSISNLSVFFG